MTAGSNGTRVVLNLAWIVFIIAVIIFVVSMIVPEGRLQTIAFFTLIASIFLR